MERYYQTATRQWLINELGPVFWEYAPDIIKQWLLKPWMQSSYRNMRNAFTWFHRVWGMTVGQFGSFLRALSNRDGYRTSGVYSTFRILRPELLAIERGQRRNNNGRWEL